MAKPLAKPLAKPVLNPVGLKPQSGNCAVHQLNVLSCVGGIDSALQELPYQPHSEEARVAKPPAMPVRRLELSATNSIVGDCSFILRDDTDHYVVVNRP